MKRVAAGHLYDNKHTFVGGVRTPFQKRGKAYKKSTAVDLGRLCAAELLQRQNILPDEVDEVIFGQVVPGLDVINPAREVAYGIGIGAKCPAHSLNQACVTGYQAILQALNSIEDSQADTVIAGGADSASDIPVAIPRSWRTAWLETQDANTFVEKVKAVGELKEHGLSPQVPGLREPSSQLTMGESAEKMAQLNHISRHDQDDFAHQSHIKSSEAWKTGKFNEEVMTLYTGENFLEVSKQDGTVRMESDRQRYNDLTPAFHKNYGTITPGNSSPLTDGAAFITLMAKKAAERKELDQLGHIRSFAFVGVEPTDQLLIGPAYACPLALDKAGLSLEDMDLIDMHEAFAAQILSVTRSLESESFGRHKLGWKGAVGKINWNKFNVNGGSIALGHPFAATGIRQVTQTFYEMKRRNAKFALVSACAAGGLAAAFVLEAA